MFDATTTTSVFSTLTTTLSTVLTDNLPVILGIFAALVGLGILIRYAKRWIGRK